MSRINGLVEASVQLISHINFMPTVLVTNDSDKNRGSTRLAAYGGAAF